MKIQPLGPVLCLVISLWISACGPTPTPAPSLTPLSPTLTQPPAASLTPSPAATLTQTPAATPTDQANCTDQAEFVSDVTVPDDTLFNPGEKFLKTWRLRNTGTCTWNARYAFVFLSGDQLSAPYSTPLVETPPQSTVDVSLELVAPTENGSFRGVYQLQNPAGKRFGVKDGNIWVRIAVKTEGTTTPATPAALTLTPAPAIKLTAGSPTPGTPAPTGTDTPTASPTKAGTSGACAYTENPDFVSQLLVLINAARATNGLPALTLNSQLSAAAFKHSLDMGCHNFLKHTGSDGSSAKSRVAAQGYNAQAVQECIYAQPPQFGGTPQAAVDWWLNDPFHRPILLSSTLTEIGIGYVNVPSGDLDGYFTLDLATP